MRVDEKRIEGVLPFVCCSLPFVLCLFLSSFVFCLLSLSLYVSFLMQVHSPGNSCEKRIVGIWALPFVFCLFLLSFGVCLLSFVFCLLSFAFCLLSFSFVFWCLSLLMQVQSPGNSCES